MTVSIRNTLMAWMPAIIALSNVASGARVVAVRKQARAVPGVSSLFPSSVPYGGAALIRLTAFVGSQPRVRVKTKWSRWLSPFSTLLQERCRQGRQGQGQGSPRTMRYK